MSTNNDKKAVVFNYEAEEAVIGSLIKDPSRYHLISDMLVPDDFYLPKHKTVYEAIQAINNNTTPADFILLSTFLEDTNRLDLIGGMAGLNDFVNLQHIPHNIEYYAKKVAGYGVRRRLIKAAEDIVKKTLATPDDTESLVNDAISIVSQVENRMTVSGPAHISRAVDKLLDEIEYISINGEDRHLTTGLKTLDYILKGLRNGAVYIMAGRPGMGKSGVAVKIMKNMAQQGKKGVMFSLEMEEEEISARLAAQLSSVSYEDAVNSNDPKKKQSFVDALLSIPKLPITIDDTPAQKISTIRSRARRIKALEGLDYIIIDHCGLARSDIKGDMYRETSDVANRVMSLAKELDVPVLALVQLNRKVEDRQSKRPMISDLRDTGRWEENAHAIMLLYRDEYYNSETDLQNVIEINVAKNRGAKTGKVDMFWKAETTEPFDLQIKSTDLGWEQQ